MPGRGRLILIGGGVRSGKSAFALARARELGARRMFIATAEAFDDEMRERAVRHREERGREFGTLEAPRELVLALREASLDADVVVVDCLTLWLSNLLLEGRDAAVIALRVRELCEAIGELSIPVIVVTNEVGLGIVPDSKLGRVFRDVSGAAHQALSRDAQELYFAVMGQLLRMRPGPVELVWPGPAERSS
ncbi:MAG: adenosylcobinamide-phosphate guanylyltransferase [Myxococcaceae bacterium]|nr:adenosylcobinamide-phosphate guanylyltransferase [Myxococcaceae bacterium]